MISVIYGKKGSGKSKKLVDMANTEVAEVKGDIVFIDDDSRAMYDLKHEIRFVNCVDYGIRNADKLYGFIAGMMAQDYDITSIYIDGIKNILEKGITNLNWFFLRNWNASPRRTASPYTWSSAAMKTRCRNS